MGERPQYHYLKTKYDILQFQLICVKEANCIYQTVFSSGCLLKITDLFSVSSTIFIRL